MDVLELIANGRTYETDKDKAELLMSTFFPTPPVPEGSDPDQADRNASEQVIE
jgi:hypothetical protein